MNLNYHVEIETQIIHLVTAGTKIIAMYLQYCYKNYYNC